MAQYNVTRDIRKLAEEAEKDKIQNPSIQDTSIAGLGLGSAYYADKIGAPKNTPKPTLLQQQIAENDARNRQNVNNQGRTKTSTPRPQPQPEPEFKIDRRTKEGKKVVQEVVDQFGGEKPPVVKDDPLPNTKSTTRVRPEPTGLRGNLIKTAEGVVDLGKNLKNIGPKVGKLGGFGMGQLVEEYTGLDEAIAGAVNIDQGMQDYFSEVGRDPSKRIGLHKLGDLTYDAFNLGTKFAGDVLELPFQTVGAGYDALMKQPGEANLNPFTRTFRGETYEEFSDGVSPSGAGMYARRPNPEMNTQSVDANVPTQNNVAQETTSIPLEDRSEAELQIMRNQEAGRPLLSPPTGSRDPNLPKFQQNFLRMKEEGKEIDDATFQSAQQFALRRGMVFDPETGFEKAQFYGQMFKGQTIGQFLRGEDAPLGYTDVIPEYNPLGSSGYNLQSSSSMRDSVEKSNFMKKESDFMKDRPDFPEGKMRLSDYKKLARHEGYKGSAVNARAKQMMSEAESKNQMTPYQQAQLASQQAKSAQASDLAERKFVESVRQYEDTVARGEDKEKADVMYKQVQSLKLLQDIRKGQEKEPEELGFSLDSNVLEGYVDVLDILGISYDHKNPGVYTTKGYMGVGKKQLTSEDLEQVKPLLGQTEFVKLLEYTQKQAQQK